MIPLSVIVVIVLYLCFLSFLDIKNHKVENLLTLGLIPAGIIIQILNKSLVAAILGCALYGILGYFIWKKNLMGGADIKLFAVIPLFMQIHGIPNMLVSLWFFLIVFMIVTFIYAVVWKVIFKNIQEIPFIPAITLTYIISLIYAFQ